MRLLSALLALVVACAPLQALAKPAPVGRDAYLGEVTETNTAKAFFAIAKAVGLGNRNPVLVIDSFGGSVTAMQRFMAATNMLKRQTGAKLTCLVETKAMSAAFIILQGTCDERLMSKSALLLAHGASTETSGQERDLADALDFIRAVNFAMATIAADRMGMPVAEYLQRTTRDWVMTAPQALAAHAVDAVVD